MEAIHISQIALHIFCRLIHSSNILLWHQKVFVFQRTHFCHLRGAKCARKWTLDFYVQILRSFTNMANWVFNNFLTFCV